MHAFGNIFRQGDFTAGLLCQRLAFCNQLGLRPTGLRRDQPQVHAHQRGGFQQGVAHIVTCIANVGEFHLA
ncbi:hypothetical protein D3C81_1899310 [compost metagenome]